MSSLPWYFRVALSALALASVPAGARAHTPPQIEKTSIGLPTGKPAFGVSRNGGWAPVYVTLKGTTEGNQARQYRLTVETIDIEETPYRSVASVPALAPGEEQVVQVYVVPGSDTSDFVVRLEKLVKEEPPAWEKVVQLPRQSRDPVEGVVPGSAVLFLGIGPGLSRLRDTAEAAKPGPDAKGGKGAAPRPEPIKRRFAFVESGTMLPQRWNGYDAVDIVVLATSNNKLLETLAADQPRLNALRNWVRRGGRLIVSVGSNPAGAAELFKKAPLLDCRIEGASREPDLESLSAWLNLPRQESLRQVDVAKLVPGPGTSVWVATDRPGASAPLVVQGACGLGRVVLVAFDVNTTPFTGWAGQAPFWRQLESQLVPVLAQKQGPAGLGAEAPDLRGDIKRGLEDHGNDVQTISFGWVALFILFYIALVGPLDYFLLKKLFKRLELTWVTFPITVLLVSVTAYAGAWALKGDDLRINKLDLIEIDLHRTPQGPRRLYGFTWFSLFSPRIQTYTVGLEPATPGWGAPPVGGALPEGRPTLMMLEGTDRGMRTGSQGLFPRPYEYAEDDSGVRGVPVPVWATRSFTATWAVPIAPKSPPIDVRDVGDDGEVGALKAVEPEGRLVGRITNNLPVELQKAVLFYRGRAYALKEPLVPGETRRLDLVPGGPLREWFDMGVEAKEKTSPLEPNLPVVPAGRNLDPKNIKKRSFHFLMRQMLFYNLSHAQRLEQDASTRGLDQSWRLERQPAAGREGDYRDEAVLVARTPILSDRAEAVLESGHSPSRLWLGELPGGEGATRPSVRGFLTQESYVRVYIPVRARAVALRPGDEGKP
jgi:hypothetical protein